MTHSKLQELARHCGIVDAYVDARGRRRRITRRTQAAILAAMGFDAHSEECAARILKELTRREWSSVLPPVTVHRTRGPPTVQLTLPAATRRLDWCVVLEDGRRIAGRSDVGKLEVIASRRLKGRFVRVRLVLQAALPFGYHSLELQPGPARMPLIVAPPQCWLPRAMSRGSRFWGVTAQLYLIRSRHDWGIGDFGDLRSLVNIVKPAGAQIIGVNPLHALFQDDPEHASPYSPASRLLLNVLNIDVPQLVRRVKSAKACRLIASPAFRRRLSRCRRAAEVRYGEVAALKLEVLRLLFSASRRRAASFRTFEKFECEMGESARRACLFLALREYFAARAPGLADWRRWPHAYRDPDSSAVRAFVAEHADAVNFQIWLQYVADVQLAAAARAAGPMIIGLYRDLAVGADPAGAETWSSRRSVVSRAQVGAPPDIYNPPGQDWGLPPFDPRGLREEGYRDFIDLIRANMRHAGGLRIDHVMGLRQLYWVPEGKSPKDGAYVEYPIDDLLGILALESHRHECIVVGEDLGTVPEGFRERMAAASILSYRVLFFERGERGFTAPEHYPELALAVLSSHDLPTLRAWWDASDLALKAKLALFPAAEDRRIARRERRRDKAQLLQALRREGLMRVAPDAVRLFSAVHTYLSRSSCVLATVQLDDLTGETDPVNIPTTTDQRRNWRRRLALTLEQIAGSSRLRRVSKIFKNERQGGKGRRPREVGQGRPRSRR